jgi:hypothetical protein
MRRKKKQDVEAKVIRLTDDGNSMLHVLSAMYGLDDSVIVKRVMKVLVTTEHFFKGQPSLLYFCRKWNENNICMHRDYIGHMCATDPESKFTKSIEILLTKKEWSTFKEACKKSIFCQKEEYESHAFNAALQLYLKLSKEKIKDRSCILVALPKADGMHFFHSTEIILDVVEQLTAHGLCAKVSDDRKRIHFFPIQPPLAVEGGAR